MFDDLLIQYINTKCPHATNSIRCTGCINDQILQKRVDLKIQETKYPFFYEGLAKSVEYCINNDIEDLTYEAFSTKITTAFQEAGNVIETLSEEHMS